MRRPKHALPVPAALAGLLIAAAVAADGRGQDHSLHWYAIHGGGVVHAGASDYRLSGTIGQPAPGVSEGGAYVLQAGFWLPASTPTDLIFRNGFQEN